MYSSGKYQVVLARKFSLNSLADITTWSPTVPHKITMVALVIDNDVAATGQVKLDKRPTAGSDTGRGDGDVSIINLTTAHTQGKVVYQNVNVTVNPGQEVVVEVTDITGAGDTADCVLWVEPVWSQPTNVAAMVLTT